MAQETHMHSAPVRQPAVKWAHYTRIPPVSNPRGKSDSAIFEAAGRGATGVVDGAPVAALVLPDDALARAAMHAALYSFVVAAVESGT